MDNDTVTINEAAKILGLSSGSVQRFIADGKLSAIAYVPPNTMGGPNAPLHYAIDRQELIEFKLKYDEWKAAAGARRMERAARSARRKVNRHNKDEVMIEMIMKGMNLTEIANAMGLHLTTVSKQVHKYHLQEQAYKRLAEMAANPQQTEIQDERVSTG